MNQEIVQDIKGLDDSTLQLLAAIGYMKETPMVGISIPLMNKLDVNDSELKDINDAIVAEFVARGWDYDKSISDLIKQAIKFGAETANAHLADAISQYQRSADKVRELRKKRMINTIVVSSLLVVAIIGGYCYYKKINILSFFKKGKLLPAKV